MALMPKRVKHRKSQRGRIKGDASRGNRVVFGDFGLQTTQGGWISAQVIEAGRIAASQYMRNEGRLYVRIFPHKSITSIPLETRMGKGKGEPDRVCGQQQTAFAGDAHVRGRQPRPHALAELDQ